jgi:hypothetical protein
MKKIITLITVFVIGFTNAQIAKYKAADFQLTSDVTKYETQEFFFDSAQNKFQMCSKKTIYLNKGLVTKIENVMNYFIYVESVNTYNYKNGQLESIETLSSGNFSTEKFIYKNGKIVERIKEGDSDSKSKYEYDAKGNLSKEIVHEDGALVGRINYSNYTASNTYYKKTNNCYNETEQGTYEQWFKNGLMMRELLINDNFRGESTYTYDKLGNQVSLTSDGKTWTNNFIYDAKGNVLKSRVIQQGFDGMNDTNYFTFAKVTFANGKTVGSLDFDANYVKKYEPKSPSYEVSYKFNEVTGEELNKALEDLKALTTSTYKIMKNEGNTFTIKDANGEEITNDVEAVKSKNDILVYDILFKKSVLLKNFYNDEVKVGEWYNMEELPSPTGLYWIFSEAPEFYIIQNGVLVDMSLYKLVKTQKEDDFIVQEAGVDKYIIRDLNSKGFETFYPLEFLNN